MDDFKIELQIIKLPVPTVAYTDGYQLACQTAPSAGCSALKPSGTTKTCSR